MRKKKAFGHLTYYSLLSDVIPIHRDESEETEFFPWSRLSRSIGGTDGKTRFLFALVRPPVGAVCNRTFRIEARKSYSYGK